MRDDAFEKPPAWVPRCPCADCAGEIARWAVVVSCVQTPCLKCRARREHGYFLSSCAHGRFVTRADAEADAKKLQGLGGKDGLHRYDVCALREDGWPLCPFCNDDELYSQAIPASAKALAGCYRCGTSIADASRVHHGDLPRLVPDEG